jgi:nitrite reductase/ring-hydroxylating ferredoxin subunit
MIKKEQVRVIKGLLDHLDNKTNVKAEGMIKNPADTYTSEDRFQNEWNNFFLEHPQIIGLSGDLPNKGSFMTTDDFGVPILATRDANGEFKCFVNVCTHRGVIVESARRGEKEKFSCPFHGWTFNNRGSLIGYPKPDHFGEIDKSCYGLKELPCAEKHGFLFVHPKENGVIDTQDLLGDKDLVLTQEEEYVTDMNWKLAIDTFGETYHFSTLHKDTLFESFYGNVQMFDTFKRNARLSLCKRQIEDLRTTPIKDWDVRIGSLPVYFLFPNIIVNVLEGGIIVVKEYPLENSPHKSVSKVSFYFTPEAIEYINGLKQENESEENFNPYIAFGEIIRDEDYVAAAASHKGLRSGKIDHILFGKNEPALHHYHNTFREALNLEPISLIKSK